MKTNLTLTRNRRLRRVIVPPLAVAVLLWCALPGCATKTAQLPPLTTTPHNAWLPGKFVWADLVTDDVATARKFYGPLFGWTFRDYGKYVIAANDERPLAGLLQRPRPKDREAKPRWIGYISVPDVERAEGTVTNAGGRILVPLQNVPGRGRQAVLADPEGAVFGVIKSSSGDPEDFLADPGDWIWIQLLSRDARRAADFYQAVGGYEVVENTVTNHLSDYVLTSEGYARATVRAIPEESARVRPTWLPFVRVNNIYDSVARARELGGEVLVVPKPGLLGGKVAVIADPSGAAIGLLEWSDDLMKGGH